MFQFPGEMAFRLSPAEEKEEGQRKPGARIFQAEGGARAKVVRLD